MCNRDEDLKFRYSQHLCSYCQSSFNEVLDLIAHIREDHGK